MLNLYVMEGCPYCKKVIDYLEEHQIPFRKLDIANPTNSNELEVLGGEPQVPFLVDTSANVKMYESDDIIEYLKKLKED